MIVYDSYIYIYIISILSSDPSCGQIVGTWDSQPLGQHRRSRVQVAPNALHHLFLFQGLVNPAVPIKGKMVKIILDHFGIFWRHWGFPNQLPVAKTCHKSPWTDHGFGVTAGVITRASLKTQPRPGGWQHAGHSWTRLDDGWRPTASRQFQESEAILPGG